jgi:ADP-ribose pyrophosphatase
MLRLVRNKRTTRQGKPPPMGKGSAMQSQQPHDEEVYRGTLIRVLRRTLPTPSGGRTLFDVVEHPDAVAIVALRDDLAHVGSPLVALVRQERQAISRLTWELPAGLVNPSEVEQPEQTAHRELREETGYGARNMRPLGRTYSSPDFTNEAISLYLATDLLPVPGQSGPKDATEISDVAWVSLDVALARCRSGEIDDSKTVLGLLLARDALTQSTTTTGGDAMPFSPTGRDPIQSAVGQPDPLTNIDPTLRLESVMLAEFNYANATAYQAMDDRGRMFGIYLGIASVLAGGVGALYELGSKSAHSEVIASSLLVLAGFVGLIFFFKIVRIRQALDDSLVTMNIIKEHYIKHFKGTVPAVDEIFRWRLKTIPPGSRFGSLTFLVCLAIMLIDSVALGLAAVVITELATNDANTDFLHLPTNSIIYIVGWGVLAVAVLTQIVAYVAMLSKTGGKQAEKQAAERAGELGLPA